MSPIGRPHNPAGFAGVPGQEAPVEEALVEEPTVEAAEAPDPVQAGEAAEEAAPSGQEEEPSVADLVEELEAVIVQRDDYLELARLKQAEFENFRKQVAKRQIDHAEQAAAGLVSQLLPVLDALDNGVGHGDESLVPVRSQLLGVLEKEGLVRVDPAEEPFDPNAHDAVAHEPGDGGEPTVAETLRAGYRWNGRLLRPAMVRVRG
ncbi:MAG: nucleotide exchange factor GrpE [Acidimicrobiales bacterium]